MTAGGPAGVPGADKRRDNPDRSRWNERYRARAPEFRPHPLVAQVLAAGPPPGPVLELACGRSGNALALAAAGRSVVAVDVSDVALRQLAHEARRRRLAGRIHCVEADIPSYQPWRRRYALVLTTRYWDPAAFRAGCRAVMPGGLVAWEALTGPAGAGGQRQPWHLPHGGLAARLPAGFEVITERAHTDGSHHTTRLLARRSASGAAH